MNPAFPPLPGGRVDVPDGDVDIETRSGDGVAVEVLLSSRDLEWARERFQRMRFSATLDGSTIRITARQARMRESQWKWNRGFSLRVRITMPERFDAEIRTAEDLNVPRAFEIAGRISRHRLWGELNGGGPLLEARTVDGSITLRQFRMP